MKACFGFLLAAALLAAAAPAREKTAESVFSPGAVRLGDTTIRILPGGKIKVLIESGNLLIYNENGYSTFSRADRKRLPLFVHNETGAVVGPTTAAAAMTTRQSRAPLSPGNTNRPTPVSTPERPGASSMRRTPFLRPNPVRLH